jgi:tRNA(adenine34) deaminase
MTDLLINSKAKLLTSIERSWDSLNAALERLSEQQMTSIQDAQGWTVKDHLIHLAAWERSAVFFLQGQPRYLGLGVDQALYLRGSFDDTNAVIFEQHKGMSLAEAKAQFQDVHQQMLNLLQPLTDADLLKTYQEYLPEETGDDRLAIDVVYGNTAGHYQEHQAWMEALVSNAEQDAHFMRLALEQAEIAITKGQEPFGAVVLDRNRQLIGAGHNTVRADLDPSAHGEIVAIRDACRRGGGLQALAGATLYTSCEPCLLCSFVITLYGIRRVVFAALGSDVPGYKSLLDSNLVAAAAWVNAQPDWAPLEVAGPFMRPRALELFAAFAWK